VVIDIKDFDLLRYACYPDGKPKPIEDMVGIDTEAYSNGEPFLCMLSDSREIDLRTVPQCFFTEVPEGVIKKPDYKRIAKASSWLNKHYCTYNLKYDSGALLYFFDRNDLKRLWKYGYVTVTVGNQKILVEYIPHKMLSFHCKKFFIKIWDVAQYFKMSLENASFTYLKKKGKIDIETKSFSKEFVKENLKRIREYCIKDAETCAELGNYFVGKLKQFGIKTTALYSPASLSYEYFTSRTSIITIKRFWDFYRDVIVFAIESYKGGKFECTARGKFDHAWQYDIVSAYPYQIRNLISFDKALVYHQKEYIKDAEYAFLRVRIRNRNPLLYTPSPIKNKGRVDIYPMGDYYSAITKQEYDYLKEIGFDVEIIDGWWLSIPIYFYPYRRVIDELFKLKSQFKGKDESLYSIAKLMMNSWYGKNLQLVNEYVIDKKTSQEIMVYRAGRAFNPIYGSIITANTRIQITRAQNLLKTDCLAVHTDSVLSLRPLPPEMTTGKLGELELQKEGGGVIVACGQYQIGEKKGAYKGFKPYADENWMSMLEAHRNKSIFEHKHIHAEGWYEAMAKGHMESVNLFQEESKKIDLNADSKRLWTKEVKAKDLLEGIEQSLPQSVMHTAQPKEWTA
jgi:hypothetical protein